MNRLINQIFGALRLPECKKVAGMEGKGEGRGEGSKRSREGKRDHTPSHTHDTTNPPKIKSWTFPLPYALGAAFSNTLFNSCALSSVLTFILYWVGVEPSKPSTALTVLSSVVLSPL